MNLKKKTKRLSHRYSIDDYGQISSWWKKIGWDPLPSKYLNDGVVVDDTCAGFINVGTNTPMAFLWPIISNPESGMKHRDKALDEVISGLVEIAEERGCHFIYAVTSESALTKRFTKRHNMKTTNEGVMGLILPLEGSVGESFDIAVDDKYLPEFNKQES